MASIPDVETINARLTLRLLGPLSINADPEVLTLPTRKARLALAVLAVRPDQNVPVHQLMDALWDGEPPPTAEASVHTYISRLRRALGPGVIVSRRAGYSLAIEPHRVDAEVAKALLREAETADSSAARQLTEVALGLWRGAPLADLLDSRWARDEARRLEDLRLTILERHAEARLDLGEAVAVADLLAEPTLDHPARERLAALRMIALYRAGRQVEALQAYADIRASLVEHFGVEPSPELRQLETAILRQDDSLELPWRASTRDEGAPSAPSRAPLLGRDDELRLLLDAFAAVTSGAGRVALLTGEPGIGKTRLVRELCDRSSTRIVWARSGGGRGAPAFFPWREVVTAWARAATPDEIEAIDSDLFPVLAKMSPEFGRRTGQAPAGDSIDADQLEHFDAVTQLLVQASRQRPIIVVVEDIQWADRGSLQLLRYAAERIADGRVLLLATCRLPPPPGELLLETLDAIARVDEVVVQRVGPLDDHASRQLVDFVGADAMPPGQLDAIVARAGGNPFYLTELARLLRTGARAAAVPVSIGETLSARLAGMPAVVIGTLQAAAVIGVRFSIRLLGIVVGDAELARRAIDEAVAAELIKSSDAEPDIAVFVHALLQEHLVAGLGSAATASLHLAIADALAEMYGGDDAAPPAQLASHLIAGEVAGASRQRALRAVVRAAGESTAYRGHTDALDFYQRALEIEARLPPDARRRMKLLLDHADAAQAAALGDLARESFDEVAKLARAAGDGPMLARALVGPHRLWQPWWRTAGVVDDVVVAAVRAALEAVGEADRALEATLLGRLALELYAGNDLELVHDMSRRAVSLARQSGDDIALGRTLSTHHTAIWTADRLDERIATAEELLRLASRLGNREFALLGCCDLVVDRLEEGDRKAVDRLVAEIQAAARRPQGGLHVVAAWLTAMQDLLDGRLDEAESAANDALLLGTETGDADSLAHFGTQLGMIRWEQDRLAEIIDALAGMAEEYPQIPTWRPALSYCLAEVDRPDRAREWFRQIDLDDLLGPRRDFTWPLTMMFTSLSAAALGEVEAAGRLFDAFRPLAGRLVVAGAAVACWGAVDFHLGLLAETMGDVDGALGWLESATALHRRLGAVAWRLHSQIRTAMVLERRAAGGDAERAAILRSEVAQSAQALGLARLTRLAGQR